MAGKRRRAAKVQLGTAIHDARFASDDRTGDVLTRFTVTDAAHLRAQIWDAEGNPVRDVANSWISAGQKTVAFERRDDNGQLLPGRDYQLTIQCEITIAMSKPSWLRMCIPLFLQPELRR
ncbi:MAG: hypothetical protein R3C26_02030 [Calditrichia bacterium]